MATRCLVVVDDIVLYKHHDGYPEYMLPYLREFAQWYVARVAAKPWYFPHFLYQEDDVSAALIVFDQASSDEYWQEVGEPEMQRPSPDIRPTNISAGDALGERDCIGEEYVYHLQPNESLEWKMAVYGKGLGEIKLLETLTIDLREFLPEDIREKVPATNPRVAALKKRLPRGEA